MKALYILSLFLFLGIGTQAQQYDDLIFNEDLNKLITQKVDVAPTVFNVVSKKYTKKTERSKKIISQDYQDALFLVEEAKKDSIHAVENNKIISERNNQFALAKEYIEDFLSSTSSYEEKKDMLAKAQIISNENNLGYFIYADSQINPNLKSKFFILSMNKMDLKIHLKKIVWKMDSVKPEPKNNNELQNNNLKEAREKLKNTSKYKLIKNIPNSESYNVLALGTDVLDPEKKVSGYFTILGEFYVVNSNKGGVNIEELVTVKEVEQKKIKKEDFVFTISVMLIENSLDKSKYVVSPGFIDQYALNRIASKKEFKGKTSFPDKVYRNQDDKLFDSMICEYNKTQIASADELD